MAVLFVYTVIKISRCIWFVGELEMHHSNSVEAIFECCRPVSFNYNRAHLKLQQTFKDTHNLIIYLFISRTGA